MQGLTETRRRAAIRVEPRQILRLARRSPWKATGGEQRLLQHHKTFIFGRRAESILPDRRRHVCPRSVWPGVEDIE